MSPVQLTSGWVTVGAAKCSFRCARGLCRVPLSKCPFAERTFAPRNASVTRTRGTKPAHAAGRTKSLTPVLQPPSERPTVFPGQAGWWQCTEMAQDEAWFPDTVAPIVLCGSGCTQERICPLLGKVTQAPLAADTASSVSVPIQKSCVIQARG